MEESLHQCSWLRVKHTRHGVMAYNINDQFIGRSLDFYGEWSGLELDLLLKYAEGKVVYDIGANIGTHTLELAKVASNVYAFEPQKQNYDLLVTNITLNALTNVAYFNDALSDQVDWLQMPTYNPSVGGNFGSCSFMNDGKGYRVHCYTLDTVAMGLYPPDLIKIDAEGHEYHVLLGAKETIKKHRPILYVECDRQVETNRVISLLEEYGYTWRWDCPWLFDPDNFYHRSENIFPHIWSEMLLCFPKEKK